MPLYGNTVFGRTAKLSDIAFADKLIELKNTVSPLETLDFIVESWAKKHPREFQSAVLEIAETRDTTYNEFAEAKNHRGSGSLRREVDIPLYVYNLFWSLYKDSDLQFDKKLIHQIWKRYPIFRVAKRS